MFIYNLEIKTQDYMPALKIITYPNFRDSFYN